MKFKKRTLAATLAASTALGGVAAPAWADGGGVAAGLFGGMILGSAIRGQREMEQRQAYSAGYSQGAYAAPPPQTVIVQQPASGGAGSVEQRITELNSLHAKGLISDSEYSSRKKAILDSL